MRYLYAIAKLWQFKAKLKLYLSDPNKHLATVCDLDQKSLNTSNIKTLALDFDGVLNSHGENKIGPKVYNWLEELVINNKDIEIFILSNKPNNTRKAYFAKHFPSIKFVAGNRKKPYPDGLKQIANIANNSDIKKLTMVDDRLTTGILAAEIFGCNACLISRPFTNFFKRPIVESFFCFLRFTERVFVKLVT